MIMFHKSRNLYDHKQPFMQNNKKVLIPSVKFNYYSVLQTEKEDRSDQLFTSNTCHDIKPKLLNDTAFQYCLQAPINNILPRKVELIKKIEDPYQVSLNEPQKNLIKQYRANSIFKSIQDPYQVSANQYENKQIRQQRVNSIVKSIQDSYYVSLNKSEKQLNQEERSNSIHNMTNKLLNNLKMTSSTKPLLNDKHPYYSSSKLKFPGAQQNLTQSHSLKSLSPTVINMNNVTQIPKIKFKGRSRFKINLEPIIKRSENNSFKQASDYSEYQWAQTERSFVKHLDLNQRQVKCNVSKEKLTNLKNKVSEFFNEKQPKQVNKDRQKIKEIITRNQNTNQIWQLNNSLESLANDECQEWQYEDYNFDPLSDYLIQQQ